MHLAFTFYFMNFKNFTNFLLRSKNRRIEHYHSEHHQDAQYHPDNLYFLLVFFIENHILYIITI